MHEYTHVRRHLRGVSLYACIYIHVYIHACTYTHTFTYMHIFVVHVLLNFKALLHIWVARSHFRCSVGTFSKKPSFVGRLKQLRFSVGNSETTRFSVGNFKTNTKQTQNKHQTNTSFCG